MRSPYRRQDDITIRPGRWVQIEGRGVGKFSGTWVNPVLGLGCSLNYFRAFDNLKTVTSLFAFEDRPGIIDCLEKVMIVDGPLKPNGELRLPKRRSGTAQIFKFEARS